MTALGYLEIIGVGESSQISPFCASAIPLTVDCVAAPNGGYSRGTHRGLRHVG